MAPTDSNVKLAAPPRVPKLAVRNRPTADQASLSTTSSTEARNSEDETISLARRHFDEPPLSPAFTTSTRPPSSDPRSSVSSNLAPNAPPGDLPKGQKKKKSNAVLGFLTLKEPSQSALEQFAEQQRKQASEKGVRKNVTGLPGVSPQRLPPTVPKVNSKWDGIPEALKAKEAASRKRESTLTTERFRPRPSSSNGSVLTSASLSSQNPPNSFTSSYKSISHVQQPPSLNSSGSSQGSRGQFPSPRFSIPPGFDPAAAGLQTRTSIKSPSMTSLPDISYYFPDDTQDPRIGQRTPPETSPLMPSDLPAGVLNAKESTRIDGPNLKLLDQSAGTEWARSPTLIGIPTNHEDPDTKTVLKRIPKAQKGFLAGEAQEMQLPGEDDDHWAHEGSFGSGDNSDAGLQHKSEMIVFSEAGKAEDNPRSSSVTPESFSSNDKNVSGQPTTNFSRPLSYQPPSTRTSPYRLSAGAATITPSVYEAPLVFEESTTDGTAATFSTVKRREHTRNISTAGSLASVTPSEMSAQWFRSPRERLGLGGRIKKNDVLPWETQDQFSSASSPGQPKRRIGRLSMFVKGAG